MKERTPWYRFSNKAQKVLDIYILGEIGWDLDAYDFITDLNRAGDIDVINLIVHSPGGSVPDGIAIYNTLLEHPAKVFGSVRGVAASAASFILMASDHISMPEDSFIMIHNAFAVVMGDADEMHQMAVNLQAINDSIINIYQKRTGMDLDDLAAMMKVETWIPAERALELGFTDTITDEVGIAALLHGYEKYFKTLPVEADNDILHIGKIESVKELRNYLRDAGGFSRKATEALVARAKVILPGTPAEPEDETGNTLLAALDKVVIPDSLISQD